MMKRAFTASTTYRVFLRSMRGAPIEDQRARAAVVVGLGGQVQEYEHDRLDDWYSLARDDDVLVCDVLECLPPPRSKRAGGIPTNKLGEIQGHIKGRKLTLIEAATGEQPTPARWKAAAQNIARGRHMKTETARKMGKKGGEKKAVETIQDYWKNHPEHDAFKAIWLTIGDSYADAFEAVNAQARKRHYIRLSSVTMAYRVFGDRRKRKR